MAGASTDEAKNQKPENESTTSKAAVKDDAVEGATAASGSTNELLPAECLIKHPLQHEWTLWYLEQDRNKAWEDLQNEVTSFDTVEDFWSLYNHIKVASELKNGCDYSLFKKGIRPMWEDERNKRGGRWMINLTKQQRRNELDAIWLDLVLSLIGESFEHSDEICGAVVNIRPRGDKIALWTANGLNAEAAKAIGLKLKECLSFPNELQLGYELHKDSSNKQITKMTYYV